MEEIMQKKAELMLDVEMVPDVIDNIPHEGYKKYSIGDLAAGGAVLSSVFSLARSAFSGAGDIYRVTIPPGTSLASFKDGSGFLGTALGGNGQIAAQARLNPVQPVPIDPTAMFMAIAVANITMKLNEIQETQKEILEFLEKREQSKVLGSAKTLDEISKDIRFHWDNEQYRNNKYILVQEIKREAEQNIIFYKERADKIAQYDSLIHLETDLDDQLRDFADEFRFYKLSMEMYARASLLEVLLIEDFESEYLNGIAERLQEMSKQQAIFYDKCREGLEKYARSTAESFFTGVGSGVVKGVGTVLSWIPLVNDTGADKALKETSNNMDNSIDEKVKRKFAEIDEFKVGATEKYVEDIKQIDMMYSKPMNMIIDEENVYVRVEEDVA